MARVTQVFSCVVDTDVLENVIVGDDVLKIPSAIKNSYNIHFPYQRGDINIHKDIGGSLTSILLGNNEEKTDLIFTYSF